LRAAVIIRIRHYALRHYGITLTPDYGDGVDGAPSGIDVPRWSLSQTHLREAVHGQVYQGRITKMGDRYLRKLLVVGACATLSHRKGRHDALRVWASSLLARQAVKYKFKLTAVALANKVARIVFAILTRGGQYDERPIAA
jgi:transposase